MNAEEELLARQLFALVQADDTERYQQAKDFRIGVSDIGHCHEYVRRMIAQIKEDDTDSWPAFIGSAIGERVEQAVKTAMPDDTIIQPTVTVTLHGEQAVYQVRGHPDIVRPHMVCDLKTVDGLDVVERTGPTQQQLFQRHLYALGCFEAGHFSVPLAQVKTANVWMDRSGRDRRFVAHIDRYDPGIVHDAVRWLDDVVYAHLNGEAAAKDPPREWCQRFCGHFDDCRMGDTDVSGLIEDPAQLTAIQTILEATEMTSKAKKMRKSAEDVLRGVRGFTGTHSVRWMHIGETEIEAFTRKGYDKIQILKRK